MVGKVSTFARRTQALDPFFHYQPWGQARNFVLSPLAQWTAETIVFRQFRLNPLTSRSDVVSVLRSLGSEYLKIDLDWLYRTLRKHKWGFMVPQRRQVLKYEPDNVMYVLVAFVALWRKLSHRSFTHVVVGTHNTLRSCRTCLC